MLNEGKVHNKNISPLSFSNLRLGHIGFSQPNQISIPEFMNWFPVGKTRGQYCECLMSIPAKGVICFDDILLSYFF